jgi:hypothetical protein
MWKEVIMVCFKPSEDIQPSIADAFKCQQVPAVAVLFCFKISVICQ